MFTWFAKMNDKSHRSSTVGYTLVIQCLVLLILSCSSYSQSNEQALKPAAGGTANPAASKIWSELLRKSPFPHTAPLPPQASSVVDGTYTKFDPKKTPPMPCRRCPDYVPEGGIWKLHLSKGVFRIFHEFSGWRSIGSFVVEENKVWLFNDPTCMEATGSYWWTFEGGQLSLQVIEDECAIHMRAQNLTKQPWRSCQPPTMEAGVGGHWDRPPGCD